MVVNSITERKYMWGNLKNLHYWKIQGMEPEETVLRTRKGKIRIKIRHWMTRDGGGEKGEQASRVLVGQCLGKASKQKNVTE